MKKDALISADIIMALSQLLGILALYFMLDCKKGLVMVLIDLHNHHAIFVNSNVAICGYSYAILNVLSRKDEKNID